MTKHRHYFRIGCTIAALSFTFGLCRPALASHHFETAEVLAKPAYNQTDTYVFQAAEPGRTVFVMLVNTVPKPVPGGVFAKDALYNIHVADDDKFEKGRTFSLRFTDSRVELLQMDAPNAAVGKAGAVIGSGTIGATMEAKAAIRLWTGIVNDPFYGNSPGLYVWRDKLAQRVYDKNVWTDNNKTSIFTGRQVGAIVLEVPNSLLGAAVKVFTTTAVERAPNQWEQIQYSARPLFAHALLMESQAIKGVHNHSRPNVANETPLIVSARAARCSALAKSQADPQAYGDKMAARLLPDVLDYKPGTPAAYTADTMNGRAFDDDGMSVMLSLVCGMPVDQAIKNPRAHQAGFPYVMPVAAP